MILSTQRCERVRKPFSTAVLLTSMHLFFFFSSLQSWGTCRLQSIHHLEVNVGPNATAYPGLLPHRGAISQLRATHKTGSISKQLNYYSQSKKNLLLNQSIQRRNIRQLLLKTANFLVLERTIILFYFFFFLTGIRNTASVTLTSVTVPRS